MPKKRLTYAVLMCLFFAVSLAGAVDLQKAKTGGTILGVKIGMSASEMDAVYSWHMSDTFGHGLTAKRTALLEYFGVLVLLETDANIANEINLTAFCKTDGQRTAIAGLIPRGARSFEVTLLGSAGYKGYIDGGINYVVMPTSDIVTMRIKMQ